VPSELREEMDLLKERRKIISSAVHLFEETQGLELQELIRQVESLAKAGD